MINSVRGSSIVRQVRRNTMAASDAKIAKKIAKQGLVVNGGLTALNTSISGILALSGNLAGMCWMGLAALGTGILAGLSLNRLRKGSNAEQQADQNLKELLNNEGFKAIQQRFLQIKGVSPEVAEKTYIDSINIK